MTPGALLRRYLLYGILGTALVTALAPFLRVGVTALALHKSEALLAQALPGPALCHLLRVRPLAPDYPLLAGRVRTEMVRGYVRLGDLGSAVQTARDDPRPAVTSRVDQARGAILGYPNIAANTLQITFTRASADLFLVAGQMTGVEKK